MIILPLNSQVVCWFCVACNVLLFTIPIIQQISKISPQRGVKFSKPGMTPKFPKSFYCFRKSVIDIGAIKSTFLEQMWQILIFLTTHTSCNATFFLGGGHWPLSVSKMVSERLFHEFIPKYKGQTVRCIYHSSKHCILVMYIFSV